MALSYSQSIGDGTTVNFAVPFSYLSKEHITAHVDGIQVPFTWLNPAMIKLVTAPDDGAVVEVRRTTPNDKVLVDFQDGSTLTESNLDTATLQTFYLAQESYDRAEATLGITNDGQFSAINRRITDVASPINPKDVVTKGWAESAMTSQLMQAQAANSAAQSAKTAAEGARDLAATKASEAAASASTATAKAVQTAADAVTTTADRAAVAADKATVAADKAAAAASASLAQNWAAKASGEVVPGQGYSARKYASDAAASAAAAALFDPSTYYTKVASDARFFQKTGGDLTGSLLAISSLYAQAQAGGNAHFWLRNADGKNRGLMYWDRITGAVVLRVYVDDGNGNDIIAGQLALLTNGTVAVNNNTVWHNGNSDVWSVQPIGMPIPIFDHIPGVPKPPTNKATYRYVNLTAGLTGSGGYNQGILTSETVSGSAPLITATAVVNLAGSPYHGKTINLINTERRFLRAGSSGVLQDDAIQQHRHPAASGNDWVGIGSGPASLAYQSGGNNHRQEQMGLGNGRMDNETRPRNVGVTYFLRIL